MARNDQLRLRRIIARLTLTYGEPRHGNLRDGFWELVYIFFSIRTSEKIYRPAFRSFKSKYRSLDQVAKTPVRTLENDLRHIGLAKLRARQLSKIARAIQRDYGQHGFNKFGQLDHLGLETYLRSFDGIGAKIAKCVTMYAFDAPSLPVDVHVWRVLSRLGYAPGRRLTEKKALYLEDAVPPELRYKVHVLSISHGRAVCKSNPICAKCCVRNLCPKKNIKPT